MKTSLLPLTGAVLATLYGCYSSIESSPLVPLSAFKGGGALSLLVDDGVASLFILSNEECPTVRATATLQGEPLEQTEEGAVVRSPWPGDSCIPPRWAVPWPVADEEISSFEIFDDTTLLTMGVRHLGAERHLGEAGAPIALRWGELALLPWSPGSDSVDFNGLVLRAGNREMAIPAGTDELSYVEGHFRFRLPPEPYDGGDRVITDGRIEFQLLQVRPGIAHCLPSLGACSATQSFPATAYPVASVAVTVQ